MTLGLMKAAAFDFNAEAWAQADGLNVKLSGTADMSVHSILDDFLAKLHQAAQDEHAAQVTLDFRDLAFMNSSCLKGMVSWISRIQDLPAGEHYRVVLISSPDQHWQRRSFHALARLAGELVTIQS